LARFGPPVYVRRQVVHNAQVVADLQSRGAVFVAEADEAPEGAALVLAAHGVAPEVRAGARARGQTAIDATCPLVAKVHAGGRRSAARGATVLLTGPRREDICYATTNRQAAVRSIAACCATMLVLGSANSSNSLRLAEVARHEGVPAHLVDDAGEVDLGWLAG